MKASGSEEKRWVLVGSSTSKETCTRVTGRMASHRAEESVSTQTAQCTTAIGKIINLMAWDMKGMKMDPLTSAISKTA